MPAILKAVDILGMEQARKWKVATLNEFRKFFGLQPHQTFLDINSDPDVAASLEALYTHPDYVELYPGIVAEEAKEVQVVGSGLCPGFTISRVILSDAVALVRGDRFYTIVRPLPSYNIDDLTVYRTIAPLHLQTGALIRLPEIPRSPAVGYFINSS